MKKNRLLTDLSILSLFYVALGVILLGWPELSARIICYALGGVLTVAGLVRVVFYFLRDKFDGMLRKDLAVGLTLVIVGVFILVRPEAIISLLPFVFGLLLLAGGASKLQTALDLRRVDSRYWLYALVMAIVTAALGAVLIWQPFAGAMVLTRFIGVSIIVEGVENLAVFSIFHRKINDHYSDHFDS